MEKDFSSGVLIRPDYELDEVFRRAEALSARHAAQTLAWSADLWHVAEALETGCTSFASFEQRQRAAAALCGLQVVPSGPGKPPRRYAKGSAKSKILRLPRRLVWP